MRDVAESPALLCETHQNCAGLSGRCELLRPSQGALQLEGDVRRTQQLVTRQGIVRNVTSSDCALGDGFSQPCPRYTTGCVAVDRLPWKVVESPSLKVYQERLGGHLSGILLAVIPALLGIKTS